MKLVLIHGRGQAGQDPAQLNYDWLAALRYGCDQGHVQLPADTVVEFAYYGDLLADLVAQVGAPLGQELRAKGLVPVPNETLQGEILTEIAARAGVSESDIRLKTATCPSRRGQLTGNGCRLSSGPSTISQD